MTVILIAFWHDDNSVRVEGKALGQKPQRSNTRFYLALKVRYFAGTTCLAEPRYPLPNTYVSS